MSGTNSVLHDAAMAVIAATDYDAGHYTGQLPVERWALDALDFARLGETYAAKLLLARYDQAPWEKREQYDPDEFQAEIDLLVVCHHCGLAFDAGGDNDSAAELCAECADIAYGGTDDEQWGE